MEDFSFPSIPEEDHDAPSPPSFPRFASSPPRFPCPASHRGQGRRKSFSSAEDLKPPDSKFAAEAVKDEERMDMLWEDLNDELHEIPGQGKGGVMKWNETGDLFCARAVPRRRPGLMMILKVLKTLLLIQKTKKRRNL